MEIEVSVDANNYPCFTIDGIAYHITLCADTKHVTVEGTRAHYYFDIVINGAVSEIKDAFYRDARGKVIAGLKFSQLLDNVQRFIRRYYREILVIPAGGVQTFVL